MPQEKPTRCTSPAGLPQERSIAGRTAARKVGRIVAGGQPRIQAEVAPDMVVDRQDASGKQPRERVASAPDTTVLRTMAALGDGDSRPPSQLGLDCSKKLAQKGRTEKGFISYSCRVGRLGASDRF